TTSVENNKAEVNRLSRQVGELKKNKQDATELMNQVHKLKTQSENDEKELDLVNEKQKNMLLEIPNLLDLSEVPLGKDENENVEYRKNGTPRSFDFTPLDHSDLGEKLGMLDFDIASKITGARFAVYKKGLA